MSALIWAATERSHVLAVDWMPWRRGLRARARLFRSFTNLVHRGSFLRHRDVAVELRYDRSGAGRKRRRTRGSGGSSSLGLGAKKKASRKPRVSQLEVKERMATFARMLIASRIVLCCSVEYDGRSDGFSSSIYLPRPKLRVSPVCRLPTVIACRRKASALSETAETTVARTPRRVCALGCL